MDYKTNSYRLSALAIELYSSKAIAGKELTVSSWCIASLYICIMGIFFQEKFVIENSENKKKQLGILDQAVQRLFM